jgi:hypothetical protein
VIDDNLIQYFRSIPEPHLSSGFSAQLRERLDAARTPVRRSPASVVLRRWAPRAYWIAAIAIGLKVVRPPVFALEHMAAMAALGVVGALALQRALRPITLTRTLRDALR